MIWLLLGLLWFCISGLVACVFSLAVRSRPRVEHPHYRRTPEPQRIRLIREDAEV